MKKEALTLEPFQDKVPLNQVDIDTNGNISCRGKKLRCAEGVVENQLMKSILGLQPAFGKKLEKLTGPEMKKNMVNLLKMGLSMSKKDAEITIVGDPKSQSITAILPGQRDFMSNTFALSMFERTMNSQPDLTLVGFDHGQNGGVILNVVKETVVEAVGSKGRILGEEFNPGYTFTNDPLKGLNLSAYVDRLACTNGMTARDKKGEFTLNIMSDGKIRRFFEEFVLMGSRNFVAAEFPLQLEKAMQTPASFAEIQRARNIILNNSTLKGDNELYNYLPEWKSVVNKLAQKGVDYVKCTDMQLQNFPSSTNVWDIVNRLTWFGSHDVNAGQQMNNIQQSAGVLFQKEKKQ
jgi:hypothetical protein